MQSVERLRAREEPTNAGIPTVGVDVHLALPGGNQDSRVRLSFHGATPLGTSSGTGEAVHLVDATFERAEYLEAVERHAGLLQEVEPGVFGFKSEVTRARVESTADEVLLELFRRAGRYGGKGCLYAVDHVHEFAAPLFENKNLADWSLLDIDRALLRLELSTAKRRGKMAAEADYADEIRLMQRKQNLGMNAILSISLALARGVAHVRGQDLYEFLREEMLVIIERLAAVQGVTIHGSRFQDYVCALREVNMKLEARNETLHETLRDLTGIYKEHDEQASAPPPRIPALSRCPRRGANIPRAGKRAYRCPEHRHCSRPTAPTGSKAEHGTALRRYLQTMAFLHRRYRMFEIANHRIFRAGDSLIVPYDAHGRLSIHAVQEDSTQIVTQLRLPQGTLITDELVVLNSPAGRAK